MGESPAVVLDVGELDARGAGGFSDGEHFRELIDVAAVDDEIGRDRHTMLAEPIKNAKLLRVGFFAGDFVWGFFVGALATLLDFVVAGGVRGCGCGLVPWPAPRDQG